MEETDINELYNFSYDCVYHMDIENEVKYKYDLSQIIIKHYENEDIQNVMLVGIFTILNENDDTRHIFNLLRNKITADGYNDETNIIHNFKLFMLILSPAFLHLYHPCICDIYHHTTIKSENLDRLLNKLN
jgi:hypothetical protein